RELAEEIGTLVRELGGAEQVDGVGAVALADLHHLVADLVDRLLPGDALPLAAGQFHRVFQPPVAVRDLAHGGTLDAVAAAVDRAVPNRFLPDPDAVLHLRTNRAADGAVGADVLAELDRLGVIGRPGGGRPDRAGAEGRERGEAADRQPGLA